MVDHDQHLRHRHHHGLAECGNTPRTHSQHHNSSSQHTSQHQHQSEPAQTTKHNEAELITATCRGRNERNSSQRPTLQSSLRWLQLCLLLLFAQDVFCFSLGYPFLPQHLAAHGHGGPGVSLAFGIYGVASIIMLLLLLLIQSSSQSSSGSAQQPAAKYWLILTSTSLAAAAGAFNTFIPDSYAVLLATKAVQGAASALYFVYTLGLVATVFPAVYKTQAMAFVSAGLTLGDALGPVVGGVVYQARGLQDALGMQPVASALALLALLMLVLAWPSRKRPWSLAQHHHRYQQQQQWCQQQQQHRGRSGQNDLREQCTHYQQHCRDIEHAATDLLTPLLQDHHSASSLLTGPVVGSSCSTDHRAGCTAAKSSSSRTPATTAAAAAESKVAESSLLQLLSNGGILSLCMLALMCQAARTAIDLLLPLMLQDSAPPGVIGLLFAGEAVGSVITPFCVDWLMYRQTSRSSTDKQQQHRMGHDSSAATDWSAAAADTGAGGVSSVATVTATDDASCNRHSAALQTAQRNPAEHGSQHPQQCIISMYTTTTTSSSSSSDDSSSTVTANRLLCASAMGMAVCCCLVLVAWQLPAAGCSLLQDLSSGVDWQGPAWLCPHAQTYGAAAVAAGPRAISGVVEVHIGADSSMTSSNRQVRNSRSSSSAFTFGSWGLGIGPQLVRQKTAAGGWRLVFRGGAFLWQLGNVSISTAHSSSSSRSSSSSSNNSNDVTSAGVGHTTADVAAGTAAAAGNTENTGLEFGLLQLLLTGLMLMVLGGCHSSCEALIYTVLTDLVAANRQAAGSSKTPRKVLLTQQIAVAGGAASGVAHSKGSRIKASEVSTAAWMQHEQSDVPQSQLTQTFQGGTTTDSCHAKDYCSCGGCTTCIVLGKGPVKHVKPGCSCEGCVAQLRSASDVGALDDATEIVMVLYVLFWVVGFTVGAGVAGMPGGRLLGQQLTGCSTGLVLGVVAWWSWSKTAAVFVQQQQEQWQH